MGSSPTWATFFVEPQIYVNSTQDPGGRLTTFLAARNERQPTVRKCCVDCVSSPDLSRSLEVKSNITGRTYSSINIESHEIHCKITVHIH